MSQGRKEISSGDIRIFDTEVVKQKSVLSEKESIVFIP